MKFIVNSSVLLKQLQALNGVISTNNTLPILDNFLFELEGNQLTITATDLETTMTSAIELEMADEDNRIAVPAKILIDTLKTFVSSTPITFSADTESKVITISAGEGNYRLSGYSAEEFPQSPTIESSSSIEIDSSILQKAISKTIFATGYDDLRPVMTGVYFKMTPDNAIFVATDAHKLVCYKRQDVNGEEEVSFILPKKPLNQLKNHLPVENSPVAIEFNNTNAIFTFGTVKLICRLIDGKYPNYQAVIPVDNPNKLIVDRLLFLTTIKRISLFASQSTYQVRLKIAGMELTVSAEDIDYSNEAKERLNCQYEGEDIEIGFNSKFLIEMLSNLESENISLEMSTPNRAGIIRPVDNENQNEDILMLVMPVMLNN
ncbi:MAG: DNA polymerase III subunit beta [Bacteroidetes bacterium ADurb.Bin408]|nr:MAG: DNA polymerase III subunit beta [Bacteroidetes bacterium ADurb.Bin408]